MLASIIVAVSYCVVEPETALAWLPLQVSQLAAPLNALLTIDAVFYVLSTTLLYWVIILCLRDCENTLYAEIQGNTSFGRQTYMPYCFLFGLCLLERISVSKWSLQMR